MHHLPSLASSDGAAEGSCRVLPKEARTMNLWFRLLYQLLSAHWRSRVQVQESSFQEMRCWLSDLDLNLHMTNSRYLALMDLGRLELITRAGLLKTLLRWGWRPVVGAQRIRFLKPIAPGAKFRLETRILGWEGKWFYIQHRFWLGEQLAAEATVKALFLGPRGSVLADEVLAAANQPQPSPSLEGVHFS